MPHRTRVALGVAVALAGTTALAAPAAAQSVADFYKGRTIAILMGTGPGGSYDLYGRTIAEHLGRPIPGHPLIIVEHMPVATEEVHVVLLEPKTTLNTGNIENDRTLRDLQRI